MGILRCVDLMLLLPMPMSITLAKRQEGKTARKKKTLQPHKLFQCFVNK